MGKHFSLVVRTILIITVAILLTAIYLFLSIEDTKKPLSGNGGVSLNEVVNIGGDFILTDHNSNIFNSKENINKRLSLIYFGFTYCPDICPTSLNKITEVLNVLGKYQIKILTLFITIDPTRDTPYILKTYLKHFHPDIIGLTGSPEEIKNVADKFKVYYAKSTGTNSKDNNYMLDHSSFIYLLDQNGKYLKHFYFNSSPEEIVNYIRQTISQT